MSKSIPNSAIFMEDTKEDVDRKMKAAFCPEKVVQGNPIFDYIFYIIFPKFGKFEVLRPEKFGGNILYNKYEDLTKDYEENKIHPMDLKTSAAKLINDMIEPVRQHFKNDPEAKRILELVRSFDITR